MGGLLTLSTALELPRELRDASVSEHEARSSGPLRVLGCPRCQRRLCALQRDGQGAAAAWKAPLSRVEKAWLGGGSSLRCRMCGQGRITVEATEEGPSKIDGDRGGGEDPLPLRVTLKGSTGRSAFRPFCVSVCGMYESVVARAASLLQAEAITNARQVKVTQHTFKRSELAKLSESALPSPPQELLVIAHKVSGQRNPLTDQHGLYNNLLKHAWSRADVVLLCLFDVPTGYFAQLLNEQPTLRGLLCAGRLLPLFTQEDTTGEDVGDAEAGGDAGARRPEEEAEAAWWLVRCLDGRVPRHEGLPSDSGKSGEVVATLTAVAAKEGGGRREPRADPRKRPPEEAAAGTAPASCTVAVLAHVAEDFQGQPLVRD